MNDWYHNIQVLFLPLNTRSILQPCDKGLIVNFKQRYSKCTLRELNDMYGRGMTVREHWKAFTVRQAMKHIREAWDEVSPAIANGVWRKLWPQVVLDADKAVR